MNRDAKLYGGLLSATTRLSNSNVVEPGKSNRAANLQKSISAESSGLASKQEEDKNTLLKGATESAAESGSVVIGAYNDTPENRRKAKKIRMHAAVANQRNDSEIRSTVQQSGGDPSLLKSRIHTVAQQGIAGQGAPLPYAEVIQKSFGDEHDLSGVSTHIDSASLEACDQMGAAAYATGSDIAFRSTPTLHTAAHEAAHIIQQRAGVQLYGGVGQAGDCYENHADAVADRVVAGESAADLLTSFGRGNSSKAVQRSPRGDEVHHYKIEIKAWIPHRSVQDPEEPMRVSNWLDSLGSINVPGYQPVIRYEYISRYRGDGHSGYEGSHRVHSVVEFDYDNVIISNIRTHGGAGQTHRDYTYHVWAEVLGSRYEISRGRDTEIATAGGLWWGLIAGPSSLVVGFSSSDPLIMTWAPPIDSTSNVNLASSVINLKFNTDTFPSHGFRIWKNGIIALTEVSYDASDVNVEGAIGAANLAARLSSMSNRGEVILP